MCTGKSTVNKSSRDLHMILLPGYFDKFRQSDCSLVFLSLNHGKYDVRVNLKEKGE